MAVAAEVRAPVIVDVLGLERAGRRRGRVIHRRTLARCRHRPAQRAACFVDQRQGSVVGRVDRCQLIGERIGDDTDLMLEMVEGEHQLANHERQVGEADRVRVGRAQRFNRAHEVIAEESDGAARKRRQGLGAGHRVARQALGNRAVWVSHLAVDLLGVATDSQQAIAPAQLLSWPKAEERVATEAALLGGLEQERRSRECLAQLEKGRDGRLAIVDEAIGDRDHVGGPAERTSAREVGLDRRLVLSRDGH